MPDLGKLPGYRFLGFLKDVAVRTGIYSGISLSIIFTAWLLIANRVPFLEPFAMERNIAGAALLIFFACIPLMRFYRSPAELLISGLLGWSLLTVSYRLFGLVFVLLEENYSAFHVFVLGAVSYLLFATVSWIGTIVWRVRSTHHSHTNH